MSTGSKQQDNGASAPLPDIDVNSVELQSPLLDTRPKDIPPGKRDRSGESSLDESPTPTPSQPKDSPLGEETQPSETSRDETLPMPTPSQPKDVPLGEGTQTSRTSPDKTPPAPTPTPPTPTPSSTPPSSIPKPSDKTPTQDLDVSEVAPEATNGSSSASVAIQPIENDVNEDELEDDEAEENKESGKPHWPGNPGTFGGNRLKFLESQLPEYLSLGNRSKEKRAFWMKLVPIFLELFPLDDYPLPARKDTSFKLKTESQVAKLSTKEKRSYRAKLKRYTMSNGKRLLEMLKNWFRWRQGKLKDYGLFKKFFTDLQKPRKPPRKRQVAHMVLSDPEYAGKIKSRISEDNTKN
ncbi:hypothetical protein PQX77_021602 [Marasmius sp. AFHP31]|nr:hypothetical protein PQX77_021602 [Marasmius sp. AFHP31]